MNPPPTDRLDAYLAYLAALCPPVLEIWKAETESEFCRAIERALEHVVMDIESGARLLGSVDELLLSWMLTKLLSAASIPTESEGYHNGHVDVTVRDPLGRSYAVLGECKVYRGYEHHCDGCKQLLGRYSSGRSARPSAWSSSKPRRCTRSCRSSATASTNSGR